MTERDALNDVAAIDDFAQHLVGLSDRLYARVDELSADPEYGPGDGACQRVEDGGKWMRGARRDLAELIRDVQGPNPPPAPRRRP